MILLCMMILLVYSNTFHASWHLDDITNILLNKNIQVQSWSPDTWVLSIRSPFVNGPGQNATLYRPVAMVTFALNWLWGKDNVTGYHLVNIGIHCATATLLYLTLLSLLGAPNLRKRYCGKEHFIALLATVLWALHPIQTQAVTYIVQRMAILSAFFYLAGIYFFVQGRISNKGRKKVLFYGLVFISYVLALGTKEHTITLPAALLLVECIFFLEPSFFKQKNFRWVTILTIVLIIILLIALLCFWLGNPVSFVLEGYRQRPFTLYERLLTESRVLIFYLSQLFYPIPQHFSIMHDFPLSQSLFNPLSTIISIGIILILILYSILNLRRTPLLCFSILFFFLSHTVESTVIGLELVFEHRNYLPSLFLFLPVASGLKSMIDNYKKKQPALGLFLICFITLLIMSLGMSTYLRNNRWANEKTLWEDAIKHAPRQARPYQNIAMYMEKRGRLHEAFSLYDKALQMEDPRPELARFISLGNLGNIYKKMFKYKNAASCLREAIRYGVDAETLKVRYNLVLCLLNIGREKEAIKHLNWLLSRQKDNPVFLSAKGFVLFKQGRFKEAASLLRRALKQNPFDKNTLLVTGMVFSATGNYKRANWYLQQARKRFPNNPVIYYGILENAIKMNDKSLINKIMADILNRFRFGTIETFFNYRIHGFDYIYDTFVPINDSIVIPPLAAYISRSAEQLRQIF